jgi:hypothetical protein
MTHDRRCEFCGKIFSYTQRRGANNFGEDEFRCPECRKSKPEAADTVSTVPSARVPIRDRWHRQNSQDAAGRCDQAATSFAR